MSKVNRARIINVIYGKPTSIYHVPDQVFESQGGNLVQNLANTGGKTTQIILIRQALTPNERDVLGSGFTNESAFFSLQSAPVITMQEHILDNKSGYITVGTVFYLDSDSKLKYYNFIVESPEMIRKGPLEFTSKELFFAEPGRIESHSKIREKLREAGRKDSRINVNIFDVRDSYYDALERFGIYADEIKAAAKYSSETGLKDIVADKFKTSEKIVFDWALPAIVKTFPGYDPANTQNINNIRNFASNNREGVAFKKDLPKYEDLRDTTITAVKTLEGLEKPILEHLSIKNEMIEVYRCADSSAEAACERITEEGAAASKEKELAAEAERFERSRQHYIYLDEENLRKEERDKIETEYNKAVDRRDGIDRQILLQEYVKFDDEKKAKETEMQGYIDAADRETKDTVRELDVLSSSLSSIYDEDLEALSRKIEEAKAEKINMSDDLDDKERRQKENEGQIRSLIKKSGELSISLKEHLSHTESLSAKWPGILSQRDLMKSAFSTPMISRILEEKREEASERNAAIDKLEGEIRVISEGLSSLQEQRNKHDVNIRVHKAVFQAAEEDKLNAETRCADNIWAFDRIGIGADASIDEAMQDADARIKKNEEDIGLLKEERISLQEELSRLETGKTMVNRQFGKYLDEKGFAYQTGENYLLGQEEARRQDILGRIPFFAGAYILGWDVHEEVYKHKEDLCERNVGMVPIITDIEAVSDTGDVYSFFNEDMTDPVKRKLNIDRLISEIENVGTQISRYSETNLELKTAKEGLRKYFEAANDLNEAKETLESEGKAVENEERALQVIQAKINETDETLAEKKEMLSVALDEATKIDECMQDISAFLQKEKQYAKDLIKKASADDDLEKCNALEKELSGEIKRLRKELTALRLNLQKLETDHEQLKKEALPFHIVTDERVPGDKVSLRLRYDALKETLNDSEKVREEKVNSCKVIINNLAEQLNNDRFNEVRDESDLPEYDISILNMLKDERKDADKQCENLQELYETAKEALTRASTTRENYDATYIEGNTLHDREQIDFAVDYLAAKKEHLDAAEKHEELKGNIYNAIHILENIKGIIESCVHKEALVGIDAESIDLMELDVEYLRDVERSIKEKNYRMSMVDEVIEDAFTFLEGMAMDESRRNYAALDKMNVSLAFREGGLFNSRNEYENLLQKVANLVKYLRDNIKGINGYIEAMKRDCEKFEEEYENYIRLLYNNLKQEEELIFKMSALSTYKIGVAPQRTIKITPPKGSSLHNPSPENDAANMKILSDYIMGIILDVIKSNNDDDAILLKKLSNRSLFSLFMNIRDWKVHLLQVEESGTSYARPIGEGGWFSGAQALLASFFLLVTEMAFCRDQNGKGAGGGFVFLDNPFAEMTLADGVKALIEVARKGDIQLYVVTAVKESQVLKAFDVIYLCKMKQYGKGKVDRVMEAERLVLRDEDYYAPGEQIAMNF